MNHAFQINNAGMHGSLGGAPGALGDATTVNVEKGGTPGWVLVLLGLAGGVAATKGYESYSKKR